MLIGLAGAAGAGKDTVVAYLRRNYGYERMAFADSLKAFTYAVDPDVRRLVDVYGWEAAKRGHGGLVRRRLIEIGTAARQHVSEGIWRNSVIDAYVAPGAPDRVAISDVRFVNEATAVGKLSGEIWYVIRGTDDPSEGELGQVRGYADHVLYNDGTVDDLLAQADRIMGDVERGIRVRRFTEQRQW